MTKQVIPAEAIDAAARAIDKADAAISSGPLDEWAQAVARAALEAAAPHMLGDPFAGDAERYNQRGDYDRPAQ